MGMTLRLGVGLWLWFALGSTLWMYFAEVMAIFPVYYAYRIKQFRIIPVLILKTEH